MNTFDPGRLFVTYAINTKDSKFTLPRRYTLTHSDETGELFLNIGNDFAWSMINPLMRDEVFGEWLLLDSSFFTVHLYIDQGEWDASVAKRRNKVFRRELSLALTAIRYGDRLLFDTYPTLDEVPIIVHFHSSYPELSKQENWGNFKHYMYKSP